MILRRNHGQLAADDLEFLTSAVLCRARCDRGMSIWLSDEDMALQNHRATHSADLSQPSVIGKWPS